MFINEILTINRFVTKPTEPEWIVITGATSGIGLEHAKIMVGLGQNLILVSRSKDKLDEVQYDLEGRKLLMAQKIVTVVCDFATTTIEKYFDSLDKVVSKYEIKEIKLVINNVGHGPHGPY
jgi:uncharacterized protein